MSAERWGALPLGELHAEGVCAFCGAKGPIVEAGYGDPTEFETALRRTVHCATIAVADICWDTAGCERRRYRAK